MITPTGNTIKAAARQHNRSDANLTPLASQTKNDPNEPATNPAGQVDHDAVGCDTTPEQHPRLMINAGEGKSARGVISDANGV